MANIRLFDIGSYCLASPGLGKYFRCYFFVPETMVEGAQLSLGVSIVSGFRIRSTAFSFLSRSACDLNVLHVAQKGRPHYNGHDDTDNISHAASPISGRNHPIKTVRCSSPDGPGHDSWCTERSSCSSSTRTSPVRKSIMSLNRNCW